MQNCTEERCEDARDYKSLQVKVSKQNSITVLTPQDLGGIETGQEANNKSNNKGYCRIEVDIS